MAVFQLFFATILLPLAGIVMLAIRDRRPLGGWIASLILAAGLAGFSLLAAPWGSFGLAARALLALLFVAAIILSLRRTPPPDVRPDNPARMLAKVLIGMFFGSVAIGVLRAHAVPSGAIDLGFPLRGGTYLVTHGGSASAANMHAREPARQYAVDLVKLNRLGMRASGIFPSDPAKHAIYGDAVVSPCDGTVVRAGEEVVLRCGDTDVSLAYLKDVTVRAGMPVQRGAPIGRVGRHVPEPHLHVHAERDGKAVPARFEGRWLVRNALTTRRSP